ncbi:Phytochelatin synthase-domain-containing protein [Leucosporidium creatinivorum]|uniref:glutathione gamma-glutamylcysteinyltransferase n=1 Tax=Leucosporidium creatinivorum TaxID=106004 RepID=A0A1Y2F4S9_9BASI|nr:Phytochelatin synthase-domain-containing protein [Leucosporidium creatinivorum]
MAEPMLASASPSFYKRPLPPSCIPFSGAEGKRLFAQAMGEGNTEGYFTLAGQLLTQNEPAFCGLGTLCMVLNALEIDPQRKWKGPWRWYEQEMLSCCRPLDAVAEVGITLNEFACLARCNGLTAQAVQPRLDSSARDEGITKFRADLKLAATGKTTMALSYSRKTLDRRATKDDMVLILDVARFKYPSYWISVDLAWDSMLPLDKATGQPRGYCLLTPLPEADPSSLLAPASLTTITLNKSSWATVSNGITKLLLASRKLTSASEVLTKLASHIASLPTEPLSAPVNPLAPLFFLALFSRKSSLTPLIPLAAKEEVEEMLNEALEIGGELVKGEVEVLVRQLGALGECCRAEEDAGAACGCAGVGKKGAEVGV